ncbi:MAG: ribonuclease D [Hyphomicrobiales bacterium]|nr:MAG: ribonuclease D [Hyphomicrobiales bacterium]
MTTITDTQALSDLCERLATNDFVTVDTEFLRESTYWPILCLIQVASDDEAALIDPMADGIDLAPFFKLMADTGVIKVFHSARQDLEIILKLGDIIPEPLFDSQIAAMVCGYGDSISYDHLVQKICRVQIDKSSRFTDWSRRPLTDKQQAYALADVTHLRDIYKSLDKQLEDAGRRQWLSDEMTILESRSTYVVEPENAWKRLKMRARKPIELAITQAIAGWRETEAKSRNQPRGRIIKDDAIYELASQQPDKIEMLGRMRALPRGFDRSKFAPQLIEVIKQAKAIPHEELPKIPKPARRPEGSSAVVELLKVLLKLVCEEHKVASKIIATVDDLDKIAESDAADVAALKGWRRELFGDAALQVKAGKLGFALSPQKKVVLVPIGD